MEYGESIKKTVMVCLPNLWCSEFLNMKKMRYFERFRMFICI